ncbi:hypothetical protein ABZ885_39000, partial [Kitasatospora sp. NPDC047058]
MSADGAPPREIPQAADQAGAADRCEALLQHTLDAVRPALSWQHGVPTAGQALPGHGMPDDAARWYVSRNRNVLTVISPVRRGALFGVVERHWRRSGHTISLRHRPGRPGRCHHAVDRTAG